MPKANEGIIGILAADLHLSLKPPVWRSAEPSWFSAMLRPLLEIQELQLKLDCPVIYAGDIFDRWNTPVEVVNTFLKHLPNGYAIPGQHDLPLHNYDDMIKSAYYNLILHDRLQNLLPGARVELEHMVLYGFPFGYPIEPLTTRTYDVDKRQRRYKLHVAVVHEYVWIDGCSYPGADSEQKFINNSKTGRWNGYDVVVFGDNHKGFSIKKGATEIFNCGSLMRRKSDEIDYRPQVGLLYKDGFVVPHYLDISNDKYIKRAITKEEESLDMEDFINQLAELGDSALDFTESIKEYLRDKKTKRSVKDIITNAME